MAIMIPSKPLDVEKRSGEGEIFWILKEALPNDVYIAHSFVIKDIDIETREMYECEIDFLVIIPNVGCIIIESKNARIRYSHDDFLWHLSNGKIMKYNGPFRQAERAMWKFTEYLKEGRVAKFGFSDLITFSNCVLLPIIDQSTINSWNLPADAGSVKFILSKDDLYSKIQGHLYERICEIIKMQYRENYKCMNEEQCRRFIETVIAPACNLLPSKHFFVDLQQERLASFLHQQLVILDFMEEQRIAVIGGGAGTGKTMIALEKAKRLNEKEEKVLFLCFNRMLKDYLAREYPYKNVRYETIDSLYYSYFKCEAQGNYNPLTNRINADYGTEKFPYENFIIDEAQDFGRKEIEGSGLLKLFQDIVEMNDSGCCYFFYDKYQLVQSKEIPSVIVNAECKMMLYKNCRNTERIATTSFTVFKKDELTRREVKGFEKGTIPIAINCTTDAIYENVSKMVGNFRKKGYKDIVILSVKEDGGSALSSMAKGNGNEKHLYFGGFDCRFTTCRKFKGLEAEVIIIVDIDGSVLLDKDKRLLFYVGASRAKFDLGLVLNLNDNECKTFIENSERSFPFYNCNLLYELLEVMPFEFDNIKEPVKNS